MPMSPDVLIIASSFDAMEGPSKSVVDWMASFDATFLQLNNERFLDLFDSNSIAHLEKNLSSVLLSVRHCHNARQPINRLPPELFANVCRYVQDNSQPTFPKPKFHNYTDKYPSPQVQIISVCRHWRDMMLPCHAFWSTIVIPRILGGSQRVERIAKHFAKQSGSVPLNIYANKADRYPLAPFAEQSSRLRVLHLRFDESWETEYVLGCFTHPAPILECLHIHNDIDGPRGADLPLLFNAEVPRLRQLYLDGIVSWRDNNFNALTHLSIEIPSECLANRSILGQLLATLQANPALEELNLSGMSQWFNSTEDGEGHHLPFVNLGQLQRLSMRFCEPEDPARLLARLELPSSASMSLTVRSFVHQENIFSVVPDDVSNLQNILEITTLAICDQSWDSCVIAICRGPSSGLYLRHYVQADDYTNKVLMRKNGVKFCEDSIDALSSLPFVGQLKELWLFMQESETTPTPDIRLRTYQKLFRHATSLLQIYLDGGNARNVLEALGQGNSKKAAAVHSKCLRALIIDPSVILPRDALLDCVKWRAKLGYPIRQLSFSLGDNGGPEDVKFLEELRRHVDVVDSELEELPDMEIPASWSEERHDSWPEWSIDADCS